MLFENIEVNMYYLQLITKTAMPIILVLFALILISPDKNLIDSFISGANEGRECSKRLLPTLLLIMCAVSAMYASGAVDVLVRMLRPLLTVAGFDGNLLPAIILRPFSGSGVTAVADKIFEINGPDSTTSKTASILMGSTDTIIYTLSMYFSAAKIKKTRYALPASFIVFAFSVFFCNAVGKRLL